TKNLGAYGDGGAIVTSDPELAERVRHLRFYGVDSDGTAVASGVNSRLDELQAALLRVKLPHLEAENARRGQIAARYDEAFRGSGVRPLRRVPGQKHAFHLYVVRTPRR